MISGKYYLAYSNGNGEDAKSIRILKYVGGFTIGVIGYRISNGISYSKKTEKFEMSKLVEVFDGKNQTTLAQYNIYGGIFEMTNDEVMRHIVMEVI